MDASTVAAIGTAAAYFAAHALDAFSPSPALRAFMADTSPRILVRTANRCGKTRHAAAKLARLMLTHPGRRYRAVAVNYEQSVRIVSRYLAEFLPASALAPGCRYSETNGWSHRLVRLTNGTTCEIRSADQDAVAHAGADLDGVWIDEPPPPAIWLESTKRVMSRRGWVWATMTPVNRPVAWFRAIVEAKGSPWVQHLAELTLANCPWYTAAQVDAWIEEARAAPWAYRQAILGDWEGVSIDRLLTAFSEVHVGTPPVLPPELPLALCVDHGEGVGHQAGIAAFYEPRKLLYVFDEDVNETLSTTAQDARRLLAMLSRNGLRLAHVDRVIGDINSAGKAIHGAPGRKLNDILAEELNQQAGLEPGTVAVERATKGPVLWGTRLVNLACMRRQLWIHPRCTKLIAAMRYWDGSPTTEKYKHLCDALRYLAVPVFDTGGDGPSYVEMVR